MSDGEHGGVDDMAHYASGVNTALQQVASQLDHILNSAEAAIEHAAGSVGGNVIQALGGAITDKCEEAIEQLETLRATVSELQLAIQNSGGQA